MDAWESAICVNKVELENVSYRFQNLERFNQPHL